MEKKNVKELSNAAMQVKDERKVTAIEIEATPRSYEVGKLYSHAGVTVEILDKQKSKADVNGKSFSLYTVAIDGEKQEKALTSPQLSYNVLKLERTTTSKARSAKALTAEQVPAMLRRYSESLAALQIKLQRIESQITALKELYKVNEFTENAGESFETRFISFWTKEAERRQAERLAAIEAEKEQKKAEKENLNEMLEFFKAMNFTQQKAMIEELKKAKVNQAQG